MIDDGSVDGTAEVARAAGADVLSAADILAEYGTEGGKGQAMWKGLHVTTGDIVAFCDADVTNFGPEFVTGTVGPLLVPRRRGLRQGVLRTTARRPARRRGPGDRAGGPPAHLPPLSAPGVAHATARR